MPHREYRLSLLIALAVLCVMAVTACFPVVEDGTAVRPYASPAEIAAYEFGTSRRLLSVLDERVREADADELTRIEAGLLAVLQDPAATYAGRKFACSVLARMGTARSVPVLAGMLSDPEVSHLARSALQRIPDPAAGAALRQALPGLHGDLKVGVISSIGMRGDREAVPLLAAALDIGNLVVAEATLAALGRVSGPEALAALQDADVPAELERQWSDAVLACAEGLPAADATDVYADVLSSDLGTLARIGALRGMVRVTAEEAAIAVLDALQGTDASLRREAAVLVGDLSQAAIASALPDGLDALTPDDHVALLGALARRGDTVATDYAERAAGHEDGAVRIAALRALGRVGTLSSIPLLAGTASVYDEEGDVAYESLVALQRPGVDEAVLDLAGRTEGEIRIALIRCLAARGHADAVPLLLELAEAADTDTQAAAFRALAELAGPEHAPELVRLLVAGAGPAYGGPEAALVAACKDVEDPTARVAPVVAALPGAGTQTQVKLIKVLGRLGGPSALQVVRKATASEDPDVAEAALRSLAAWDDPEALDALLKLATHLPDRLHRVLALRGYIRLLGLPGERHPLESLAMYETAMAVAERVDERRMVLGGVGRVPHPDALSFTTRYLETDALDAEARAACLQAAISISGAHHEEAVAALERLRATADVDERFAWKVSDALEALADRRDYITAWRIAGPYYASGVQARQLLDREFAPESDDAGSVMWQPVPGLTDPERAWMIDLEKVFTGQDRAAYLVTRVYSPRTQPASLLVGSDDAVKIWLNGEVVHENNVFRSLKRDEDDVDVTLLEGWNPMMVKLTQGGGQWSLCVRLRRPYGGPIEGVRAALE